MIFPNFPLRSPIHLKKTIKQPALSCD